MDIRELLSPQDSSPIATPPRRPSPSPLSSLNSRTCGAPPPQRKASGLSQSFTPSPISQEAHSSLAAGHVACQQHPMVLHNITSAPSQPTGPQDYFYQAPIHSQAQEATALYTQPQINRKTSTPQMDTLADLASMQQHHQQSPANHSSSSIHDLHAQDQKRPSLGAFSRSISTRSGTTDIAMGEDMPPPPKDFVASSLDNAELARLKELATYIRSNSFDFQSHVAFINLLHKGFVDHVASGQTATSYELLDDLRQARETMDRNFPVGEELWLDWIDDERCLAETVDQCLSVARLSERAVQDEPNSVPLWKQYCEYWHELFVASHSRSSQAANWSDKDRVTGKDVFTWDLGRAKWDAAYQHTRWRLNDSNVIFDRYMELLLEDESNHSTPQKVQEIDNMFNQRLLKEPHATWDQTAQAYSSFITRHHSAAGYEQVMADLVRLSVQVKNMYKQREAHEDRIEQARRNKDRDAEWLAYSKYLEWEVAGMGPFSFPIINGLYQRATIRFASHASLWTDYIEFLMQNPDNAVPLRPVLERATRHCPWSGDLWSHRLLTLEAEGENFKAIEEVKHRATANGMLDAGGMEELIKVSVAWCGCLRRRAFEPGAADDEIDIAEMGIRSALEHVRKIGERKYGTEYRGDPQYRLERMHIKFLTQRGELNIARDIWRSLVQAHANFYDFWYRYYIWEMVAWAKFAGKTGAEPHNQLQRPAEATAVLSRALQYHETMDWPEQLVQMFLHHCEQHEGIQQLRSAIIEARKISSHIAKRREKENAERTAYYEQHQQPDERPQATQVEAEGSGKRKRESEGFRNEPSKKAKSEEQKDQELKRDREHTVVLAKNIPLDATEANIRNFFRDCGTIVSIKLMDLGDTQSASIEFQTYDDALSAQTRTMKKLKGHSIEVDFEIGKTLWVTNYPPAADEQYIRGLFKDYDIIAVRFPTLIKNARRRFCYIEFATADDAINASQLDGIELEDKGEKYILQAKISDPSIKDARHGALEESREVFVKGLHFKATEADLQRLMKAAGPIESVRIPRTMDGNSKGFAFVVYETAESAAAALDRFQNAKIFGRPFSVEKSQRKEQVRPFTIRGASVASASRASPTPSSAAAAISSEADQPQANGTENSGNVKIEDEMRNKGELQIPLNIRERTLALWNIPDTVPAARLEKLLEPFGAIKRLTLRPDHSGAIVEFVDEKSVHAASLGLNGTDFEGFTIQTGSSAELMQLKPMQRQSRVDKNPEHPKKAASSNPYGNAKIRRPQDRLRASARGRGGFRGAIGRQSRGVGRGAASGGEPEKTRAKTNEDFRAMLLGSQGAHDATEVEDEPAEPKVQVPAAEEQAEDGPDELMDDLMGGDDDESEEDVDAPHGDANGGMEG